MWRIMLFVLVNSIQRWIKSQVRSQVPVLHPNALFDMHNKMVNHALTLVFWDPMSFNTIWFFKFMCSSEYSANKLSLEVALKMEVQGVQVRTVRTSKTICSKTDPSVLKMIIDPLQIFHRTRGWALTVLLEHCSCIIRAEYSLKVNKNCP